MFDLNELPENDALTAAGRVLSASLYSFASAGRGGRGGGEGGRRGAAKAKAKKVEDYDEDDDVVISLKLVEEDEEEEEEEEEEQQDDDDDDEDLEEEERQVYFTNGNSTQIVSQLLRDDNRQTRKAGKSKGLRHHNFLRLDGATPAICYTNDWQRSELVTYDENDEVDIDNEVTVAALDARAIDSQIVSRLDSAVSLIVPTKSSAAAAAASFGIPSPRPDKLGQKTESSSGTYSDFTRIQRPHRSHSKWEGVLVGKRGGNDKLVEHELNFDSEISLLHTSVSSSCRKGKRAREEGNPMTADTVLKLKRHVRPTPAVIAADSYDGAGPSLSMSLDPDAPAAENSSFSARYKIFSKGQGKGSVDRDGTTSLSLGRSSLTASVEASGVLKRFPGHWAVGKKASLALSSNCAAAKRDRADEVEVKAKQLHDVHRVEEGLESGIAVKSVEREEGRVKAFEKPVWQGKLSVQGCSTTGVTAYSSVDLGFASRLWSLPPVVTIDNLITIEEFFRAAIQANVVEPVMRLKLLPDADGNGPSFSSLVTILQTSAKMRGGAKDQYGLSEVLGWQTGPQNFGYVSPLYATGPEYVFLASPQLTLSKEIAEKTSSKLYLVLGSSLQLVSTADRELANEFFEGIDWSLPPEENYLFGFLCIWEEEKLGVDKVRDSGEAKRKSSPAVVDISTAEEEPGVPPGFHSKKTKVITNCTVDGNGPERINAVLEVVTSEVEDATVRLERDEEGSAPNGIQSNIMKDHKAHSLESNHEAACLEKSRERREIHSSLRHNHSPIGDDGRNNRDRQRDRDRDIRAMEKEKDLRNFNKDGHRYSYRSSDKGDLSKRDRSKDREGDRSRERLHRLSHRDLPDRLKNSRDRPKELEKHKDWQREKEIERERPMKKRARSPEPEKVTVDDGKFEWDSAKARSSARQEESVLEFNGKERKKRNRVDSEEVGLNNVAVTEINNTQQTDDTKLALKNFGLVSEPVKAISMQKSTKMDGLGQGAPLVVETNGENVESVGETETLTPVGTATQREVVGQADQMIQNGTAEGVMPVFRRVQNEDADEIPPGFEGQTGNRLLLKPVPPLNRADRTPLTNIVLGPVNGLVAEIVDTTKIVNHGTSTVTVIHEEKQMDGAPSRKFKELDKHGTSQPGEYATESLKKDAGPVETGVGNIGDVKVELHNRAGDAGSDPPHNHEEGRMSDVQMVDGLQRPNSKILSVRVDNSYCLVEGHKSENEVSGDSGVPRSRVSLDVSAPSLLKSVTLEGDDQHGSVLGVESLSSATENGSSPGLSSEVSCETLLEDCDKETRGWLASKQSALYFDEEFGLRIRLENVEAKPDSHLKAQQGSVDVKVSLLTEKSTNTNEGKWFLNQAVSVLEAISSRGIFSKCLWYQGQVQRYAGDQAPAIQVIVKRIKGEDGKKLEKIQEETGVMIGIVRNAIGNSTRVIGLRLKGMRKKGIQEATEQVELLLSQVAVHFFKVSRVKPSFSQDAALLKLKVECSTSTSPSSGILTPMQKDVFAAYSPVSPVASLSPLGSLKHKMDEPSIDATFTASVTAPTSVIRDSTVTGNPAAASVGGILSQSQQSEDEHRDKEHRLPHLEAKYSRPLLVSNLPERASASMLRELFEDVLKDVLKMKFAFPPSYKGVSDLILDVRFSPDGLCAFIEFASDELLLEVLKIYADNKPAFYGLTLELGSSASHDNSKRMIARTETTTKGLECSGDIMDSIKTTRSRTGRKDHKSDDHDLQVATLRSSPDSDVEVGHDQRFDGCSGSYLRSKKPSPLFLTELMRNSTARSIHTLFEDILKKYNFKGRATVMDVRFIPSRGCAFVYLATPELVDFMLDLYTRRPEIFYHMKMEVGQRPLLPGPGEEEPVVKRSSHLGRNPLVEESHSYASGRRARGHLPSSSPPPANEVAVMDHEYTDDYEDDEEDERQPMAAKKRRSDPERTVYADRLPDNASEGMIRRIFERVLRDNMTSEQREVLGENIITEVRYVPTKFCAFIVFVAQELTRLVLQLYNQDEEIFKNMRLKPHFHSRMEDLYREDLHDREDGPVHRGEPRDMSLDRRSRRGLDDYQNGYKSEITDIVHRRRNSAAHRAVAATAFKEVDRRRSVYVDRIPERLPEPTVRDLFERAMRRHRHGYRSHSVSQVTFFRDKFDPEKLCAFVELEHEDMVQELLDTYLEAEEAFSGMRVRPAIKYGH